MTVHQIVLTVIGFFAAVALVVIVALAPNYVQAATVKPKMKPQCGTAEQMKAGLKAMGPSVSFSEIGEFGTKLFLAKYNSMPPLSNIVGDRVIIVEVVKDPRVSIAVFKGGCFDGYTAMDRSVLRNILRSV